MVSFTPKTAIPRMVVGISDMAVTNSPNVILSTYALGSCVGVLAFSKRSKAVGLLHAMLPVMRPSSDPKALNMFVNTGMNAMLGELSSMGVAGSQVCVALLGGASVNSASNFFRIGEENVLAVKEFCRAKNIRIAYEDSGGKVNRTVHFTVGTGVLEVKKPQDLNTINLV